jgi:hypothetical protein
MPASRADSRADSRTDFRKEAPLMKTTLLVCGLLMWLVRAGPGFTAQPGADEHVTIEQNSTGVCSPNFANIIGHVTFICNGVNAEAMKVLNVELAASKQKQKEQLAAANVVIPLLVEKLLPRSFFYP